MSATPGVIRLAPSDLTSLPRSDLRRIDRALREATLCQAALARTGHTVASDLYRPDDTVDDWHHYPPGDVYDDQNRSQFYFHRHPADQRVAEEAGHFHLFRRSPGQTGGSAGESHHLIAISIDATGGLIRLFATNRWVTGESWLPAEAMRAMVDGFAVEHAQPSWPANRWITAVTAAFADDIRRLIDARDVALERVAAGRALDEALEDREVEVLSEMTVDLPATVSALTTAMLA